MRPKPDRAVGPRERQFFLADTSGLLQWHVPRKSVDIRVLGNTVEQGKGRVPCLGNHAVRAQLVRQIMREGHQRIASFWPGHSVDRMADTTVVDPEAITRECPALARDPAQQNPHKTQPTLVQ